MPSTPKPPLRRPVDYRSSDQFFRHYAIAVVWLDSSDQDWLRVVVKGIDAATGMEVKHEINTPLNLHSQRDYEERYVQAAQAAYDYLQTLETTERPT